MAKPIELEINGKRYPVNYPADTPLLYVLRDELGPDRQQVRFAGKGNAALCTVLDRGNARAALARFPLARAATKHITTIEGLEKGRPV